MYKLNAFQVSTVLYWTLMGSFIWVYHVYCAMPQGNSSQTADSEVFMVLLNQVKLSNQKNFYGIAYSR